MSNYVQNASFYVEGKEIEIFKSNALVEGAFDLSPAEHDLMTLAINKLFSQGIGGKEVFISAKEFAIANKINENYAYEVLAETAKKIHKRTFKTKIYKDDFKRLSGEQDIYSIAKPKGKHELMDLHANWIQAVAYQKESGFIAIMFSDVLAYLIQKTGEAYTKYPYEKTIELKRFHTKRLYEFCCKWAGSKPPQGKKYPQITMIVDEWKEFFGCADKYGKVAEFKRRVIEPVINEINQQGEFELTLEQEKIGKMITHFTLIVNDKRKKPHPVEQALIMSPTANNEVLHGLTDKELVIVRQKVAEYIAHLESKGELVNDFHRKNIENKAIAERWGLDEYYQRIQQAENDRLARLAEIEQQRQKQAKARAEQAEFNQGNQDFIKYFESLPKAEQKQILAEIDKIIPYSLQVSFTKAKNDNMAHKLPMYRSFFEKIMGI